MANETGSLQAFLDSLSARLAKLEARLDLPLPVPPAPPLPAPGGPTIRWRASMEGGNLSEWDDEVNTGNAETIAITASAAGIPPKSGNWVMRQTVTGTGGTRMHRYPEVEALSRARTPFVVSWWHYFPQRIGLGPGGWSNTWQIASRDAGGTPHPVWAMGFTDNFTPVLHWNPSGNFSMEGPQAGEPGGTVTYQSSVPIPVAQWVFFEAMVHPASDFSGALKIWMNDKPIFDLARIKTRFLWEGQGGFFYFTLNAYGANWTPVPAHIYVDDVTVSLVRLPVAAFSINGS
jgi:hypothetical protein